MNTRTPKQLSGLRHVALRVKNLEACLNFYTECLGMKIDWHPDADNVYLTSGNDNLALHRTSQEFSGDLQRLDHIGFIIDTPEEVSVWHEFLIKQQVTIKQEIKDHRDGTRSFYCEDPDGNLVQMIYLPKRQ